MRTFSGCMFICSVYAKIGRSGVSFRNVWRFPQTSGVGPISAAMSITTYSFVSLRTVISASWAFFTNGWIYRCGLKRTWPRFQTKSHDTVSLIGGRVFGISRAAIRRVCGLEKIDPIERHKDMIETPVSIMRSLASIDDDCGLQDRTACFRMFDHRPLLPKGVGKPRNPAVKEHRPVRVDHLLDPAVEFARALATKADGAIGFRELGEIGQ